MALCTLFDFSYSACVFVWYSENCTPQRIPWWLDSTFKFCDRFIAYYIWLYPLLYSFWPSVKNTKKKETYDRSIGYLRLPSDAFKFAPPKDPNFNQNEAIIGSEGVAPMGNSGYQESMPNIELDSDPGSPDSDRSSDNSDKNNYTGNDVNNL